MRLVAPQQAVSVTEAAWTNYGGSIGGIPAPIVFGGSLFTFARNRDDTLGMCAAGVWSSLGGALASAPAAAPAPNGLVAVVARSVPGTIQSIYVNPSNGQQTTWSAIGNTPAPVFAGAPAVVQNSRSMLVVFSLDKSGNLWSCEQLTLSPTTWGNWTALGAPKGMALNTASSIAPFVVMPSAQLQAAAGGQDGNLYQWTASGWSMIGGAGPQFFGGCPAAFCSDPQLPAYAGINSASMSSNNPIVFALGNAAWGALNVSTAQQPSANGVLVMTTQDGLAQLFWSSQNTPGQMQLAVQSSPDLWYQIVSVGTPLSGATGLIAGIAESSNIALLQTTSAGTLAYLSVAVQPPQMAFAHPLRAF
jgi:hypothetical protein